MRSMRRICRMRRLCEKVAMGRLQKLLWELENKIQRKKDTNNINTKKKYSMMLTAYVGSLVTILILHAHLVTTIIIVLFLIVSTAICSVICSVICFVVPPIA